MITSPYSDDTPFVVETDLAELASSGLTELTIRLNSVYTELDPAKIAQMLNRTQIEPFCNGGLVFPYLDKKGNPDGYCRIKPHNPRHDPDDEEKIIKYESPCGQPPRAYIPLLSCKMFRLKWWEFNDKGVERQARIAARKVIITEGQKENTRSDTARLLCHRHRRPSFLARQGYGRATARPGKNRLDVPHGLYRIRL
jgi:hypothetical protein